MENNDLNDIDDFDSGIELDKIEVPKILSSPISEKAAKAPVSEKSSKIETELDFEDQPEKSSKIKLVIAISFVFLIAAPFLMFKMQILKVPFMSQNSPGPVAEYHSIDPIITNLGADRHVKISIMIKSHAEIENQVALMEPIVRDSVLMFLTAPDTQQMVNQSDLTKVKSYIDGELTNVLQNDYHDEVVLKELAVY